MRGTRRDAGRAGFTLVEILVVAVLIAAIFGHMGVISSTALRAQREDGAALALEDQAHLVLGRIERRLRLGDGDSMTPPAAAPAFTDVLDFQSDPELVGDAVVFNREERIERTADGRVVWTENPGQPDERRVTWTSRVRPLLEGEVLNGMDDNGNGLIDEAGLCFAVDGNTVRVWLSLERALSGGVVVTETVNATVVCRN